MNILHSLAEVLAYNLHHSLKEEVTINYECFPKPGQNTIIMSVNDYDISLCFNEKIKNFFVAIRKKGSSFFDENAIESISVLDVISITTSIMVNNIKNDLLKKIHEPN